MRETISGFGGPPLFSRWPEWASNAPRRASARERLTLYRGEYRKEVEKMIDDRVIDMKTRRQIKKNLTSSHGLAGATTDAVAVAYQRGARRELRGVADTAARAFGDIVVESGLPEDCVALNAVSWITGPVILAPYVAEVDGEFVLCKAIMFADRTEVLWNPHAPTVVDAVLHQREDGVFCELDKRGWKYYDRKGYPIQATDGRAEIPHNLDYCPAVAFRSRPWLAFDWWNDTDHIGLCDATREVAYRLAVGLWVRSVNATKLTVVVAPIKNIPAMQAMGHPSQPLWFNANPNEVQVSTMDRSVGAADYLAEITAISNAAVSRYGIPPSAVSFTNDSSNWGNLAISVRGETLAAQRDAQAPLLVRAERRFWTIAADVVRASRHRHAGALLTREDFKAALRCMLPDLSDPKERKARLDAFAAALPYGLANAVDELMSARPEMTRYEAIEEIAANLDEYARLLESLASRNVSLDAAHGVGSIAELQGRQGGEASAKQQAQEKNDG